MIFWQTFCCSSNLNKILLIVYFIKFSPKPTLFVLKKFSKSTSIGTSFSSLSRNTCTVTGVAAAIDSLQIPSTRFICSGVKVTFGSISIYETSVPNHQDFVSTLYSRSRMADNKCWPNDKQIFLGVTLNCQLLKKKKKKKIRIKPECCCMLSCLLCQSTVQRTTSPAMNGGIVDASSTKWWASAPFRWTFTTGLSFKSPKSHSFKMSLI